MKPKPSFTAKNLPVAKIRPNPWNPNYMNRTTELKLHNSLHQFGFIDPITVRSVNESEFDFEIVDGEHRFEAAVSMDLQEIPAVIVDLTDTQAKKFTIIANELKGKPEPLPLAQLVADIQANDDHFLDALPFSETEVEELYAQAEKLLNETTPLDDPIRAKTRIVLQVPEPAPKAFKNHLDHWLAKHYPTVTIIR